MSVEFLETGHYPIAPAEQAIVALLERKWQDYYPMQENQDVVAEKRERVTTVLGRIEPFAEVVTTPEKLDQVSLCSEMIWKLESAIFTPFNTKMGAAIASSMQDALAILAPGLEHKYDEKSWEYQAFANYYIMLAGMTSGLGAVTALDSRDRSGVTLCPADTSERLTQSFGDGSQRNAYHASIKGDYGARELRDHTKDGELIVHELLRQSLDFAMHARPGVRAAFSLTQIMTSNSRYLHQSVLLPGRGTEQQFSDFSIRVDKDNTSRAGFSLDIGRDARDDSTMQRPGDVVGKALRVARPEHGCHFPEHFAGVSDRDFDEFTTNLNKFLQADAEMAQMDFALRSRDGLNNTARWERSNSWTTTYMNIPPLTRGASGYPPFMPGTRSAQK